MKLALYALGCAAFVAAGLFLVVVVARDAGGGNGYKALAAGAACIAFFGLGLIVTIARFFEKRSILIIDESGVRDLRIGARTIPWPDIQSVSEHRVRRQTFFAIHVRNPMQYVEHPVKRLLLKLNRLAGFPGLNLSAHGLDISQEQLRRELAGMTRRSTSL